MPVIAFSHFRFDKMRIKTSLVYVDSDTKSVYLRHLKSVKRNEKISSFDGIEKVKCQRKKVC